MLNITKQTDKAIFVEGIAEEVYLGRTKPFKFWCPKSVVKDGFVAGWFLEKKIFEAIDNGYLSDMGSWMIVDTEVSI